MVIIQNTGRRPKSPSPHDRWSVQGTVVGASALVAAIAAFTGHFELGVVALGFCLVVALIHANAVEPGKARAPVATGFLAASAVCAALAAIAGPAAIYVAGIFATALYGAGLAFGVFARLEWFQRLLALATAVVLVAGVVLLPRPPPAQRLDPSKAHIELTVYDREGRPVPGAAAACSVLNVNYLEDSDRDLLRTRLTGDFSRTDENGKATIELDGVSMEQFYVCVASMPNASQPTPPPAFSDPQFVPPVGATFPASVHFAPVE